MPDLISIGLGGGTIVRADKGPVQVGPDSVGYRVKTEALINGGETLTLSDISTAARRLVGFGDRKLVAGIDDNIVDSAIEWVDNAIQNMTDRMKASRESAVLIAVGGGSHLVPDKSPESARLCGHRTMLSQTHTVPRSLKHPVPSTESIVSNSTGVMRVWMRRRN